MGNFSKKIKRQAFKKTEIYQERHNSIKYEGQRTTLGRAYRKAKKAQSTLSPTSQTINHRTNVKFEKII